MTTQTIRQLFSGRLMYLMLAFIGMFGFSATQAATSGTGIETEDELRQYVAENTDQMIARLDELRAEHSAESDEFYLQMEDELTDFVDFRRIAARVMARYARQASPEQRDAFVEKFKRSLFDTYARALGETTDFTVSVSEARFLSANEDRASVDLTVTSSSGKKYSVVYSLFENDEGRWMMENVIVEGVNIGLAFRDRFQQEMEAQRGNIQAVIDNWSGEVEALEEKTGQGASGNG